MHAGITLRYRGVHGGYWALAEQHPEWVGTTVHLVDPGIDTGGILAQSTFERVPRRHDRHVSRPAPGARSTSARSPDGQGHGWYGAGATADEHRPRIGFLLSPDDLGLSPASLAERGPMNECAAARLEISGHASSTTIGMSGTDDAATHRFGAVVPEGPPDEVGGVRMANQPGALVISLDFELHWGVRDHVTRDDRALPSPPLCSCSRDGHGRVVRRSGHSCHVGHRWIPLCLDP